MRNDVQHHGQVAALAKKVSEQIRDFLKFLDQTEKDYEWAIQVEIKGRKEERRLQERSYMPQVMTAENFHRELQDHYAFSPSVNVLSIC